MEFDTNSEINMGQYQPKFVYISFRATTQLANDVETMLYQRGCDVIDVT